MSDTYTRLIEIVGEDNVVERPDFSSSSIGIRAMNEPMPPDFLVKPTNTDEVQKVMKLKLVEFIRRFLLHVLPKGYQRIRYYGFLSNRARKKSLSLCFKLLGKAVDVVSGKIKSMSAIEILKRLTGIDISVCPSCGKGKLVPVFAPGIRAV